MYVSFIGLRLTRTRLTLINRTRLDIYIYIYIYATHIYICILHSKLSTGLTFKKSVYLHNLKSRDVHVEFSYFLANKQLYSHSHSYTYTGMQIYI